MQVTIYINENIIRKVDQLAGKKRWSRSKIIQKILEKEMGGKEDAPSALSEVYGILSPQEGEKFLKVIASHGKNSSRFE